jgi:hypothetical protein
LGIEPECRIIDFEDPEQAQLDENIQRKDFLPSEIYEIYNYYHEKLSKQGIRTDFCTNDAEVKNPPRKVVSDIVGIGAMTLTKINGNKWI